jgi:hypothetical protein
MSESSRHCNAEVMYYAVSDTSNAVYLRVRLQVLRQTQALKESLGLSDSQAAQLSREVAQLRTALAETQAAADTNQQQVGAGMSCASESADMLCDRVHRLGDFGCVEHLLYLNTLWL